MSGNDDIIPEKTRTMADIPPPPPPGSPHKSPMTTPSMARLEIISPVTPATFGESATSSTSSTNANNILSPPLLLEIEEGTPAAEALKANADVRVSKLRKVGRSTRLQAGVRVLKSAARTASGQPGHAGDRRGAPEFVAPRAGSTNQGKSIPPGPVPTIPEVDDEGADSTAVGGSQEGSVADQQKMMDGDDSASLENLDKSINIDDSGTDRDNQLHGSITHSMAPSTAVESLLLAQHPVPRHSSQHVTHAALPAAVAAACRAGEEMDRKRATQLPRTNSDGRVAEAAGSSAAASHKSPLIPFASLFKSTAHIKDADSDASPTRLLGNRSRSHRRAASVPEGTDMFPSIPPTSVFRRASMDHAHKMPSEISVAETEKHANLRGGEVSQEVLEDLSDDEIIAEITGDTTTVEIKKHSEVDPIVVEVPGTRPSSRHVTIEEGHVTIEEVKEEEVEEEDTHREDLMSKAKKRISRRGTKKMKHGVDDDAFHFHSPKAVRKWVKKRHHKEESKQRSYVKGKVIDGQHELYTMSIAVMFGMRTSIGRTNLAMSQTAHNERRWLDNDDLMAVEKYEFPPRGSDITPPHQLNHTFKFKDYSPLAFAYLRRMFGVNEYDFLLSVCGNANYIEFQSNAKSGQFFFYSPDGKYMIKTMTNTESKFLRRIMPHYFRHCAMNPNTLVTKFLGMYRVKLYHLRRNVKFVVMKSVYDTDKYLHQLFDVKGSTTGRDAKPSDAVKKDNDIRRTLPDGAFALEPGLQQRLRTQVIQDCQWLKSMKIMDYSMLIGVHNISHRNTKTPLKSSVLPSRAVSNDDGDDSSNLSHDASNATLDRYLDVDDDDSYLDGYNPKGGHKSSRVAYDASSTSDEAVRTVRVVKGSEHTDEDSSKGTMQTTDAMVEQAIEDMYWPFHRFYDIQGLRRMNPIPDTLVGTETKKDGESEALDQQKDKDQTFLHAMFASGAHHASMAIDRKYNLPSFERPLSYRKDGGFMMDTTNSDLPLKMSVPGAPHLSEYCDGKIFYMGIIDILQQFNIRKRGEARWRRMGGKGWDAASCVHPTIYADRFVRFFDEYTDYHQTTNNENSSMVSDGAPNQSEPSPKAKKKTM